MTRVLNVAVNRTPSHHTRSHSLFQTPLHRHRKAANVFLTTTHAKGGACYAYLETVCQSQQSQQAHAQKERPDISRLDPALQQQWDHAANAHLGNIVIKPKSVRKCMWTCDQCPDGHLHRWSSTVYNRTNGNGCPQCSGHKVCKNNSLATKAPLVAAQWDFEANNGTPNDVAAQSSHRAQWRCQVCDCSWEATPNARVSKNKSGCPQCANARTKKRIKHPTFAECQHPLLSEWDHGHNAAQGHHPDKIRLRSHKQISWLCTKCPAGQEHKWFATPFARTGRIETGCPFCAGRAACSCNSLLALYPDIAAEWDYSNNPGQPGDYPAGSYHVAWWSSHERGSWQQSIYARTNQVHQKTARLRRIQQRQSVARDS